MVPRGFRFNPTDEELIEILDKKISGQEMPVIDFIAQMNVYDHEPQDLEWNHSAALSNDERYYYCKRETDSREVIGRGWWKATSHVKRLQANDHLVGYKRPLTFHRFKDNDRNRNNAIKTNWIMHEYSLESRATEWRLCKIKCKRKASAQEEKGNVRQSRCASSSGTKEFEAGSSRHTQVLDPVSEQQQQETLEYIMPVLESDQHRWNMQQLQQQNPYDPCPLDAYYSVFEQQEQLESSDQIPYPNLWSWQS